jgi:hypothetical protein
VPKRKWVGAKWGFAKYMDGRDELVKEEEGEEEEAC